MWIISLWKGMWIMNNISINLKKEQNLVKINPEASYDEVMEELQKKLPKLKTLYKEEKTPLYIVGKHFENEQMDEITKKIQKKLDIEVFFDSPKAVSYTHLTLPTKA